MTQAALRRDRLASAVAAEGLDGLLVTNPVNVTYLTGFTGEASYLLLGRGVAQGLLVTDGRFTGQLADECPGLPVHVRSMQERLVEATSAQLRATGWETIGLESGSVVLETLEGLSAGLASVRWSPRGDRVETLRAVKDADEITLIRASIAVAEAAFMRFLADVRPGDTEIVLHHRMEQYIREAGGAKTAFPTIVAVDRRAALPHAPPTEVAVAEKELLLVDWGAVRAGYHSDLTRVIPLRSVTPRLRQVMKAVGAAQSQAIAAIRPGVTVEAVDAEARRVLTEAGFGDWFTHGLGHGLGLQIHEAPFMRPGTGTKLAAGMVVTVEPGVYLPEWGGVRIEDDVLVTPDGHEVLTHIPHDLTPLLT